MHEAETVGIVRTLRFLGENTIGQFFREVSEMCNGRARSAQSVTILLEIAGSNGGESKQLHRHCAAAGWRRGGRLLSGDDRGYRVTVQPRGARAHHF